MESTLQLPFYYILHILSINHILKINYMRTSRTENIWKFQNKRMSEAGQNSIKDF